MATNKYDFGWLISYNYIFGSRRSSLQLSQSVCIVPLLLISCKSLLMAQNPRQSQTPEVLHDGQHHMHIIFTSCCLCVYIEYSNSACTSLPPTAQLVCHLLHACHCQLCGPTVWSLQPTVSFTHTNTHHRNYVRWRHHAPIIRNTHNH